MDYQPSNLEVVSRRSLRSRYQPSRIVIGLFPADTSTGVNAITLCYVTHSSHKPRTMTVAIEDKNYTHRLIRPDVEFVLSVPGPTLLDETLFFGTASMHDRSEKVSESGVKLVRSAEVGTPSLGQALGNIELSVESFVHVHDHMMVTGKVHAYTQNTTLDEPPLVSIGPDLRGYRLLRKSGIHRVAVARWEADEES